MGRGDAAKHSDIYKCFFLEPLGYWEDVYLSFLGESGGISVIDTFMDGKHNPVTNLEKIWSKIGFPHFFVVDVNRKWILNSPLPPHKREFRTKTNNVHNINTHEKRRVIPRSNTPFPSILYNCFS